MIGKSQLGRIVWNRTLKPYGAGGDLLRLALLLVIPGLSVIYASGAATKLFPEVSSLTAQAALPDPLVMLDGRRVSSKEQWVNERRPELKALFEHYMYGAIPPKPEHMQSKLLGDYHDFLSGKATLKLVRLEMGSPNAPQIDLMLLLPNEPKGPAPVFLAMDFCGNHALT